MKFGEQTELLKNVKQKINRYSYKTVRNIYHSVNIYDKTIINKLVSAFY